MTSLQEGVKKLRWLLQRKLYVNIDLELDYFFGDDSLLVTLNEIGEVYFACNERFSHGYREGKIYCCGSHFRANLKFDNFTLFGRVRGKVKACSTSILFHSSILISDVVVTSAVTVS